MVKTESYYNGTRYSFDRSLLPKGYYQIDTSEDAYYYGNWINPIERKRVAFAEGDLREIQYESDEEMVQGLKEMDAWEKEHSGSKGIKIDLGWHVDEKATELFKKLELSHLLY
jgi:hypothetical protein